MAPISKSSGKPAGLDSWEPFVLLVLTLVALGSRLPGLGFPAPIFDEAYYMPSARPTFLAVFHGPLGLWLIAVSGSIFGHTPFGYRILPMLGGVLCVPLTYALGKKLFPDERTGLLAALLVAFDPMLFMWTRLAFLDGFLCLFLLASALAWSYGRYGLCAILVGLSLAVKLLAAPLALGLVAVLCWQRRWRTLPWLALIPLSYAVTFSALTGIWSPGELLARHLQQLSQLGSIPTVTYLRSPFWSWFLVPQSLPLSDPELGGPAHPMTLVETPAILWSGAVASLMSWRRAGILGLYIAALLLPWSVSWRGTYFYYLVPVLPYVLILLAHGLETRAPAWARGAFLGNALLSFAVLYSAEVGS